MNLISYRHYPRPEVPRNEWIFTVVSSEVATWVPAFQQLTSSFRVNKRRIRSSITSGGGSAAGEPEPTVVSVFIPIYRPRRR